MNLSPIPVLSLVCKTTTVVSNDTTYILEKDAEAPPPYDMPVKYAGYYYILQDAPSHF
ncbi:protein of unknown function [Pseudodesulfovibrio piezophilus C1TLV30]|uniref:Uncharacterized protein n=1 Tax=Pseudodesulfovibrio piezophilus (strain DSM 21447 / JCM 15486 / C1TLV30) TaxID=1322246 RepID=M1WXU0_PSEP2|nr:protein of unknown function [Pseudodesulfovibrio piezophilus C1TLV30]